MVTAVNPETGAESLTRIIGAGAAILGLGTLYGLYLADSPYNWLSNLGISISDNSWRSLGIFGIASSFVGIALYTRKGLWLVILAGLITLTWLGHKYRFYSIGQNTSTSVRSTSVRATPIQRTNSQEFISTGVHLTASQKAWCNKVNGDGLINRVSSPLARKNCSTGIVYRKRQQ